MNKTNFEHAGFAFLIQLPFGLFGHWFLGGCIAIAYFFGREQAQREYKLGDPAYLKWYVGLDFHRWSLDAKLDLVFPVITVHTVTLIMEIINGNT